MDRIKKIQLLKDIKSGKKTIENSFDKESMVIFIHTDERITDEKGKEYTKNELSELEKTKNLDKVQFIDARKKLITKMNMEREMF